MKRIVELLTIDGLTVCIAELIQWQDEQCPVAVIHDDRVFLLDESTACRKRPRYLLVGSVKTKRSWRLV